MKSGGKSARAVLAIVTGLVALTGANALFGAEAAVSAPEQASPPPETASAPFAPLAWLADRCFTGTFGDGRTKDFICYDWRFEGKFLRSRHRVIGGPSPYAGETWFGWDAKAGRLEFSYFNTAGATMRGAIEPQGDSIAFPVEKFEMNGKAFELRSSWTRKPDGGYLATTERRVGDAWQTFMTIDFVPAGPASDWTEE